MLMLNVEPFSLDFFTFSLVREWGKLIRGVCEDVNIPVIVLLEISDVICNCKL